MNFYLLAILEKCPFITKFETGRKTLRLRFTFLVWASNFPVASGIKINHGNEVPFTIASAYGAPFVKKII